MRLHAICFDGGDLAGEDNEPAEEHQTGQCLDIRQRIMPAHPLESSESADGDREIRHDIHRFGKLRGEPRQSYQQYAHQAGESSREHVMQNRMRRIPKHADTDEGDARQRQHERQ